MKLRHDFVEKKGILQIYLPERIDNKNAIEFDEALNDLINNIKFDRIILEASELNYIASVGIRTLMKLKKDGYNFEIVRVKPEVEEMLVHLGLDTIIPIFTLDQVLYTNNLKKISESSNYIIFDLGDNKAVKVIKNQEDRNQAIKEKNSLQEAFLLGIPSTIPYDYIRTMNGKYGLVFDLPKAISYETQMINSPDKVPDLIDSFVNLSKEYQNIDIPTNPSEIEERVKNLDDLVAKSIITNNERNKIKNYFYYIPNSKKFIFPDLDFRNIIKTEENETLFVHINKVHYGHPLLGLYRLYYYHYLLPEKDRELYQNYSKLSIEEGKKYTDQFIMKYFGIEDTKKLEDIYYNLRILSLITMLDYLSKNDHPNKNILIKDIKDELLNLLNTSKLVTF